MGGPEAQENFDNVDSSLDDRDYADLDDGVMSTRELASEIEGLRKDLISRTQSESEGVISELEAHRFVRDAKKLKSRDELRRLEKEFTEHLTAQRKLMEEAGRVLGKRPDLLDESEGEEIMARFPDMSMKQKEKELDRIRKMMQDREKEIASISGMDEEVRKKLEEEMKDAENYGEKLKTIEKANETNRNFQKYKKLWETGGKMADQTKTEYFEWFLSLSPAEQKWAINKARKEDIEPRTSLYDLHEKLPDEHQDARFGKWGRTERMKHLSDVERKIQREFMKLVWSQETDMSNQSKTFAIKAFEQVQGKDPKVEGYDRIFEKIRHLEEFPKHAKAEAELRTQMEKFDAELYGQFTEQFNRASFEEKTKIIDKVGKLDEKMQKSRKEFSKFDPEIKEHFEGPFMDAKTPDEKDKIIDQMNKFKEYRTQYFKLREQHDDIFGTDIRVYEKWYNEHVTNVDQARTALAGMKKMVAKRLKIFETYNEFDQRVQERCPNFAELPTKKKIEELKKLKKLQQNLEAIDALKETAETLIAAGMEDKALTILKKARKLDPEDPEIIKSMKRLAKNLGREEEIDKLIKEPQEKAAKKRKRKDEKTKETEEAKTIEDDDTDDLEDEFDASEIEFTQTEIRDMRRTEETVEMVEDNVKRIGGNIQEDSVTRAGREYKGGTELEQEIIDEVTDPEKIIGRCGMMEDVISVDFRDTEPETEDLREVQEKITSVRKRDTRRGVLNVEIRGHEHIIKADKAREKVEGQKDDLIGEKVQDGLMRLHAKNVDFTDEQMEAVKEVMAEQAEEELRRKVEVEKIYKQAA